MVVTRKQDIRPGLGAADMLQNEVDVQRRLGEGDVAAAGREAIRAREDVLARDGLLRHDDQRVVLTVHDVRAQKEW